eukprot:m.48141 g.48141  ORF g.48141 m.48141 type:complete len:145 (-) comp6018_c0_seq3:105-539(-)
MEASHPFDAARVSSAKVKERVDLKSAHRRDERSKQKEEEARVLKAELEKARQIPIDLLAQEWLADKTRSPENRLYLVEHVLPTLALGLEKLLLATGDENTNVNPVNWLAQWLIRNNPKYLKTSQSSPYVASLKAVKLELQGRLQ